MGDTPRIYVASLMDYNAGTLHGRWIDCDSGEGQIWEEIREMLAESPEAATDFSKKYGMIAEEWAIHDYEGFAPLQLSEYEDIAKVAAIGELAEKYGTAFLAWMSHDRTREPDETAFEDVGYGEYSSWQDYAYQYADDFGLEKAIENLGNYISIDYDAIITDAQIEYEYYEADDGTIYVFMP